MNIEIKDCKNHAEFMKSILDKIVESDSRYEFDNYYDILIKATESLYKMKVTNFVLEKVFDNQDN